MTSPWMNTDDAAVYLCYAGPNRLRSVYRFIERHGIAVRHDGKRLLLTRLDVERAAERGRQYVRRARQRDQSTQSVHDSECLKAHTSSVR